MFLASSPHRAAAPATSLIAVIAAAMRIATAAEGPGVALADRGRTEHVIVQAAAATPAEQTAATELATYLARITGAEFRIVAEAADAAPSKAVYVGWTQFAAAHGVKCEQLGGEEWLVRPVGDNLIVTGGRPRGTLYAVWELLEHFGCVWAARDAELVPRKPTLDFSGTLSGRPAIRLRNLYTNFHEGGWGYDRATIVAEDWFRQRNRQNSFGYVGEPRFGGGEYMRPMKSSHTADSFYVPWETFFASHPDYFAMGKDGKRIDGTKARSAAGQLCYTSEGARQVALAKLRETIAEAYAQADKAGLPRPWLYDISQADNYDWCHCPRCRELIEREAANSATLLTFINALAADIETDYPEVRLTTMAYMPTVQPPKTVRPRSNVVVRWIDWGGFKEAPDTTRPLREQPERADNFLAWTAITPAGLAIWDYGLGNAPANVPFNPVPVLADDVRFYAENHVRALLLQSGEMAPWREDSFKPLYDFIALRLMAQPEVSLDEQVGRFMAAYFGAAAEPMRAIYDDLAAQQRQLPPLKDVGGNVRMVPFFTAAFFQTLLDHLAAAEQACAAADDPAALRRVRRESLRIYLSLLEGWDAIKPTDGGEPPFDRAALLARLRTAGADVLSVYPEKIRPQLTAAFAERVDRIANPKPLPAELADTPRERVIDLYGMDLYGKCLSPLESDPDSSVGQGLRLPQHCFKKGPEDTFGIYDKASNSYGPRRVIKPLPQDGRYQLYHVGRYTFTSSTAGLFTSPSWHIGVPLGMAYNQTADAAGNTYDVYVSAKCTGPIYIDASTDSDNGFWLDRVILVRAEPH
jgi:hypothetical protein